MMENLVLRIKISVLWIFMGFTSLALLTLNTYDPNSTKGLIPGLQITPQVLLGAAIMFLTPFVMAFVCLILRDSLNRWANIIVGLVFAIFQFSGVAYGLSRLAISDAYLELMQTAVFVAPALIVWYAYRWPKEGK
jgi:hypothetical protein